MDKSESEGAHRTKLFWLDEIAREDRGTRGFIGNIRMSKQSQGFFSVFHFAMSSRRRNALRF